MNRSFVVVAVALIGSITLAGRVEAKNFKSPVGNAANGTLKASTAILKSGTGASKVNEFSPGKNADRGYVKKAVHQLPANAAGSQNIGKLLPVGHGPVLPPAPPITFGGNPPRAPSHDCDRHHGDCHEHCRFNLGPVWLGDFCFDNLFGEFYGACSNDCSGDVDFDSCP